MSSALKTEPAFSLENFDISNPDYFEQDIVLPHFARLRAEDPVHYCDSQTYGPYWSITRYKDIVEVDTNHKIFSSANHFGGVVIADEITNDPENGFQIENFISMDQPRHANYRKAVQPIASPPSIASMEALIRERTQDVLDELPINQEFDWVARVSVELTTRMLATLFDFPYEDRALLTRWSDITTAEGDSDLVESQEARIAELMQCLEYFTRLWNERVNAEPKFDLVSMLAHDPNTQNMTPEQYLGNLLLLIVGGNDTTRNSMSGGILQMHKNPAQREKLNANPALIDNAVQEIIRYHTPLPHMRRTALADYELGGKQIKKGDKVVMWYYSGNRDEDIFPDANRFDITRENANRHLSFGFGIHRCMGLRLAELQLRILWEEILNRWNRVEVIGSPKRLRSNFVNGITEMKVKLHP